MQRQQEEQEPPGFTPARELKFENILTAKEIARILCTSALEIVANVAFIGKRREYLWARLKGVPQAVDLLSRVE